MSPWADPSRTWEVIGDGRRKVSVELSFAGKCPYTLTGTGTANMGLLAAIRSFFSRRVIAIVLQKSAPSKVPTSGEEGRKTNCFATYLVDGNGEARVLVTGIQRFGVSGKWSAHGGNFVAECSVPNKNLSEYTLHTIHWYKGWTFQSNGTTRFILQYISRYPLIRVRTDRLIQYFFNRKKLERRDRVELLSYIIDETVKNRQYTARKTDILSNFYTKRWVLRPDKEELMSYYDLLLDSLKETGDISYEQFGYALKPKAINTIAEYQLEERRHGENRGIQRRIFWLTFALVVISCIQAGSAVWEAWNSAPKT